MEKEAKIEKGPEVKVGKELSLQEKLEKAEEFLEKARTSTGKDRSNAVFNCEGIFIDADLGPEDLQKIGTSHEELDEIVFQGDKEEARESLEKARSSKGQEKIDAAEICKSLLEGEASKRKEVKAFTPKDIDTTIEELDKLIDEGEEEIGLHKNLRRRHLEEFYE